MAVMRHSIIFGGIDSADFGIYIGGEGTFNAPQRDVEMISIPGRDGAFALDKGRFENIEVKYTVINQEPDLATFSANLEGFRNALCSQRGYQRLEDTFHPDEYRMAVFADKFEVKPIEYNTASKFDIVFNCKPQRYLTEGETAVSVSDGDTLTNPTLFEAHPLLEVEGYGVITFSNGYTINITDEVVGNIVLIPATTEYGEYDEVYEEASRLVDYGDTLTLTSFRANLYIRTDVYKKIESVSVARATTNMPNYIGYTSGRANDKLVRATIEFGEQTFTKRLDGAAVEKIDKFTLTAVVTKNDNTQETLTSTIWLSVQNYNDTSRLRMRFYNESMASGLVHSSSNFAAGAFVADSTQSVRGNPVYIDCDLGEAYKMVDGAPASLNRYIDLGSKLPTLAVGGTEITFDNTITDLKVTPRWWRV